MTKFYVTVDGKEYLETFIPDAECVFCEVKGAYRLGDNAISFCEKCLKENYKKVREENE